MIRIWTIHLHLTVATVLVLGPAATQRALAELPTPILHSFAGGATDGAEPYAGLTLSGSTLYGTTANGGASGIGTVFSLDTASNTFTLLHTFSGGGGQPFAGLTLSGSTLYGTTYAGGVSNRGTVFNLDIASNTFTLLHSFSGGATDGAQPSASLTLSGSTLYGTTEGGGASGVGTVFSLGTASNAVTLLHSFSGGATDGAFPEASLTLSGSTLFGTTVGGGPSNIGSLFSLQTAGNAFTLRHIFAGGVGDGNGPLAGLTLSGSTVYGTTVQGGASGLGTVFSLDTTSNTFTLLHSFKGGAIDGANPYADLILSGSTLYGTTLAGGASGLGTVFSLDTTSNTFTLLHSFKGGAIDGASPEAGLTLSGSTLYGTTSKGGAFGHGTIFVIQVSEPSCLVLATMGAAAGATAVFSRRRKLCALRPA